MIIYIIIYILIIICIYIYIVLYLLLYEVLIWGWVKRLWKLPYDWGNNHPFTRCFGVSGCQGFDSWPSWEMLPWSID